MVTMVMEAILKISNPKSTFAHPKDHSCEASLQSDQKKKNSEEKKNSLYDSIVNSHNYLGPSKYTQSSPSENFKHF